MNANTSSPVIANQPSNLSGSPELDATSGNIYQAINSFLMSPSAMTILFFVLFIYFLIVSSLGSSEQSEYNGSVNGGSVASNIFFTALVFVALVFGLKYLFYIDIVSIVANALNPQAIQETGAQPSASVPAPSMGGFGKEVFNVPGNKYTYDDAKALCKAYNSRLATYGEVESAYNSGGEWCNYGWSEGQMALYPTQQSTYDMLQKVDGHKNDCGRPGVNGGYIENPAVRFGVNCFGYKPKMRSDEEALMASTTPYPKTKKDIELEKRVAYWKDQISSILLSPFNHRNWSKL